MKKYLLLIEDEELWKKFKSSIKKDINRRIINETIAGFLPNPSVLTIKPQSRGPTIVANLPTVE